MKYSYEQRLVIVQRVKQGEAIAHLSKEYHINETQILAWVRMWDKYGPMGLEKQPHCCPTPLKKRMCRFDTPSFLCCIINFQRIILTSLRQNSVLPDKQELLVVLTFNSRVVDLKSLSVAKRLLDVGHDTHLSFFVDLQRHLHVALVFFFHVRTFL